MVLSIIETVISKTYSSEIKIAGETSGLDVASESNSNEMMNGLKDKEDRKSSCFLAQKQMTLENL